MTEATTTEAPETTAAEPDAPKPAEDADAALGEGGQKALKREREAAKAAKAEADRLKAEAEAAQVRVAELEAGELRRGIAAEKGLTDAQAKFLTGDSPEAMAAQAEELLAAFKPSGPSMRRSPVEVLRSGATGATETGDTVATVAERVMRGH